MSGPRKAKPVICWDSCCYLGKFKREQDKPLVHLDEFIRDVEQGELTMLLPVIVVSEVLNLTESASRDTLKAFSRQNSVIVADATYKIAELAAELREARDLHRNNVDTTAKGLKAPDALILATAAIYKCSRLYTFDPVLIEIGRLNHELIDGLQVGFEHHPRLIERDNKAIQDVEAENRPLFSRLDNQT